MGRSDGVDVGERQIELGQGEPERENTGVGERLGRRSESVVTLGVEENGPATPVLQSVDERVGRGAGSVHDDGNGASVHAQGRCEHRVDAQRRAEVSAAAGVLRVAGLDRQRLHQQCVGAYRGQIGRQCHGLGHSEHDRRRSRQCSCDAVVGCGDVADERRGRGVDRCRSGSSVDDGHLHAVAAQEIDQ